MGDFQQLISILQQELSQQEKLLSLLSQERAAIVKLERDRINEITVRKEKLVNESRSLEDKRSQIIRSLAPATREKLEFPKLTEIITWCPTGSDQEQLKRVGTELKALAKIVHELNSSNADLIRHSLGIVTSALAIVDNTCRDSDLPAYGKSGAIPDRPGIGRARTSA